MADITINNLTEVQVANDNDYIAIDNGTATAKIKVQKFNETGAASAAQSAAAAAQSALDAETSKVAAIQAKDDTQALITSAQTIVSNASDYADSAQTSANAATSAASTASSKASQAADSAELAADYAANVNNYAKEAKSWAVGGTGTRSGEDTDNAKYYANEAHDSETNAAASESAAAISENNAATSETNAATSESNASTSAINAAMSESNAATSATNAATSESNAAMSETNAASSATTATNAAASVVTMAGNSEAWAVGQRNGQDVPSTDPTYQNNAKYWAEVAAGAAGGGVSSFNGRSGIVVGEEHDYNASQIDYSNSSSGLVATNVQAAIDEVNDNLEDLDNSLASVAKSGNYSDLSGKPTLAAVATSGAYADLTGTPTLANVATSGNYSDLNGKPTLGTAAAKNSTNVITQGGTDLVETGAVYTGLAAKANTADLGAVATSNSYNDLNNKPSIPTVTVDHSGTASSSGVRSQRIGINGVYNVIDGTKYMEQAKTLSTSADVTYTFSNAAITTNSAILPFASIFGIVPKSITVSNGSCSVVIPKYTSAVSCTVRIYIM